jgi:peptidoglycan/xylan/chitin deacetylase (PgdA/CDA1 family)
MRRKLTYRLRNPILIILPIVLVLGFAWRSYTLAARDLSLPTAANLLVGIAAGDPHILPPGWDVSASGGNEYGLARSKGYVTSSAATLHVSDYHGGDIALATPKVSLKPSTRYLFKSYYSSDISFGLLAHYYYNDGSDKLVMLNEYPAMKGTWSTVSDAIDTAKNIVAVSYVYRLTSPGSLTIDGAYLEPSGTVYVHALPEAKNIIPNPGLSADEFMQPSAWGPYHAGDNTASFSYDNDADGPYLTAQVTDYKNGEAKWEHDPLPVQPHRYYTFQAEYKSDVPVDVVAEYTLQGGQRQFVPLATALPASQWTSQAFQIEVPDKALYLAAEMVLHRNGTLATRGYSLTDMTRPGAPTWKRPLVSITFDDGWQSSYADALPLLRQHGYQATFYINPSSIETPNFMTAAELADLRTQGSEIAAHGYEHDDMTAISTSKLDYDLHQGRDYLHQAGFPTQDFATPYGRSDAEVAWYARKYFATVRGTEDGVNTRQNFDQYDLQVLYMENSTPLSALQAALTVAKQSNGWLILVYHRVGPTHTTVQSLKVESATISTDSVGQQWDAVAKSGITVEPVHKAFSEVSQQ